MGLVGGVSPPTVRAVENYNDHLFFFFLLLVLLNRYRLCQWCQCSLMQENIEEQFHLLNWVVKYSFADVDRLKMA